MVAFIPVATAQGACGSWGARSPPQGLTEHHVLSIQPVALGACDEELAAVGAWTTVCLGVRRAKDKRPD